jgi:hypothetical protein
MLAGQAGVAIENARLYQEAHDRTRRLEAVREIATAILAGTNPDQVLSLVARHARELVRADLATLAVPAGPGELVVGVADGLHAEELAGTVFPVEGSVSGEVIRTAKTVAVPDAASDQRADPAGPPSRRDRPGSVRAPGRPRHRARHPAGGPVQCRPARPGRHLPGVAVPRCRHGGAGGRRRRPRVRPGHGQAGGQGLGNLRARARALGGQVEIDSHQGEGTRVRVQLTRPSQPT